MKLEAQKMNRVPSVAISMDGSLVADLKRCGDQAGSVDLVLEFGIPHRELTEADKRVQRLETEARRDARAPRLLAEPQQRVDHHVADEVDPVA